VWIETLAKERNVLVEEAGSKSRIRKGRYVAVDLRL